jgi:hypothetical protein
MGYQKVITWLVYGQRDASLDTLLDLDGQVLVLDEKAGYWVKFDVKRVLPTKERPHGLDYSITLHATTMSAWWVSTTPMRYGSRPARVAKERRPRSQTQGTHDPFLRISGRGDLADSLLGGSGRGSERERS